MIFFTFNNTNIQFAEKPLKLKFYTTAKAPLITKQIKTINKKNFAQMVLNKDSEIFMVYIIALKFSKTTIYSLRAVEVINDNSVQIAILQQNNASTKVPI